LETSEGDRYTLYVKNEKSSLLRMTIAEFDFLEGRPLSERISSEKLIK